MVIDGPEGAGKSTALQFIKETIEGVGHKVLLTREPGGTPLSEELRRMLLSHEYTGMASDTELLMMFAARAEHIDKVIKPALAQGTWILSDRFTSSTYAYQCGGRGIPWERVESMENWVQGKFRPDMTLILDVPVEVSLERVLLRNAGKDRFESEQVGFFERVRQNYLEQCEMMPGRYRRIDATKTIPEVQQQLASVLKSLTRPAERQACLAGPGR